MRVVQQELANPFSLRSMVFKRLGQLLSARRNSPAFHPHGRQSVLDLHPSLFALERHSPGQNSRVTCLHNVSRGSLLLHLPFEPGVDLITGRLYPNPSLSLEPFQVLWVKQ
jgi:hypothetical protein